jgi:hypothetical protein
MPKLRMSLDVTDGANGEEETSMAVASAFTHIVPYLANEMSIEPQHLATALVMELLIELEAQGHDSCVRKLIAGAQRMIDENDRGDAALH